MTPGQKVTVGGLLTEVNKRFTKKGDLMAICTLEDMYGRIELVIFPKAYEEYAELIFEGSKVFVKGRTDLTGEEEGKLIAESIKELGKLSRQLWIQYPDKAAYEEDLGNLLFEIGNLSGNDRVIIYLKTERAKKDLGQEWTVNAEEAAETLRERLGTDNVKIVEKL